jgi:hypothetical protein
MRHAGQLNPWYWPKQRSLAYQGCVLPILTYGSALWYAPLGIGVSKHVRCMECVHSFALNWITGTFWSTPLGARGVIAGIPPLRIILDLRFHGLKARITTLRDYHIVHSSRSQRWTNPALRNAKPKSRPRHLPDDNPLTRLTTDEVREQFAPFMKSLIPALESSISFLTESPSMPIPPRRVRRCLKPGSEISRRPSHHFIRLTGMSYIQMAPIGISRLEGPIRSQPSTVAPGKITQIGALRALLSIQKSSQSKWPSNGHASTSCPIPCSLSTTRRPSFPSSIPTCVEARCHASASAKYYKTI